MSLQLDPHSGKITYKGKEVGEQVVENGRSVVRLNIEFESGDDCVVPLSWFAHGLSMLAENQPLHTLLSLETAENSIAEEFEVPRFLTEKQIKRKNFIWSFHKTDADNWPSPLHGHEYDKGLILDAVTGDIYDSGTRQKCKKLKQQDLSFIQGELKTSKDFCHQVKKLIGDKTS